MVAALLAAKADLEAKAAKGNTPLLLASATGVTDVVEILIESGADVTATNDNHRGPRQMAK